MKQLFFANRRLAKYVGMVALITMLLLSVMAISGAPQAHAETYHQTSCGVSRQGFSSVTDSYGHNVGTVSLHYNSCNGTVWATFLSNNNTWRSITVTSLFNYIGQAPGNTYNTWYANHNFDSPSYYASPGCWAAEVNLTDNRGQGIYVSTSWSCY